MPPKRELMEPVSLASSPSSLAVNPIWLPQPSPDWSLKLVPRLRQAGPISMWPSCHVVPSWAARRLNPRRLVEINPVTIIPTGRKLQSSIKSWYDTQTWHRGVQVDNRARTPSSQFISSSSSSSSSIFRPSTQYQKPTRNLALRFRRDKRCYPASRELLFKNKIKYNLLLSNIAKFK